MLKPLLGLNGGVDSRTLGAVSFDLGIRECCGDGTGVAGVRSEKEGLSDSMPITPRVVRLESTCMCSSLVGVCLLTAELGEPGLWWPAGVPCPFNSEPTWEDIDAREVE